jgi:hypothetical protein
VWEDATIDGLVRRGGSERTMVFLTERGRAMLGDGAREAAD